MESRLRSQFCNVDRFFSSLIICLWNLERPAPHAVVQGTAADVSETRHAFPSRGRYRFQLACICCCQQDASSAEPPAAASSSLWSFASSTLSTLKATSRSVLQTASAELGEFTHALTNENKEIIEKIPLKGVIGSDSATDAKQLSNSDSTSG